MLRKLQKHDYFFIIALIIVLIMHLSCIYGADHFADESFYPTIPLRLLNGDSLVQDEWHVTQFSSLFLYIPVSIWMAIKGSTEGIILFLRYFYLVIHTGASVGIYAYFRKYKAWAIVASMMFYSQVPLRFLSANYHSLLALFLLLFTIALLDIYENERKCSYILAGMFFACCCVCNPFECLVFPVYGIACVIWACVYKKHSKIKNKHPKSKNGTLIEKHKILCKYFSKKAFLRFTSGIAVVGAVSVVFFFATGGTLSGLIENIPNLLDESMHNLTGTPTEALLEKFLITLGHFNSISFGLPFLLPIFFIVILIDKKRSHSAHKLVYLILSLAFAVFYTVGVTLGALSSSRQLAMSLPFFIVTLACYILSQNKDKKLFYCMWLPGVVAAFVQYFASNMHLSIMWTLTISNIAGVFFIKNILEELVQEKGKAKENNPKSFVNTCKVILCICVCLQLVFQCTIYVIGRTVKSDYIKLETGPYAGFRLNSQALAQSNGIMDDLDIIKSRTEPDDPVLIISEFSWMYLYLERPFASYSAWMPVLECNRLEAYYSKNPDKIPKYIYVGWVVISDSVTSGHVSKPEIAKLRVERLDEILNFGVEELSNGYLLTVYQD